MKPTALAIALTAALALAMPALPAHATMETLEARVAAAEETTAAKKDLRRTFGKASLRNGEYVWKDGKVGKVTRVVISLNDQMAYAYEGDRLIGASTISSGRKGHETPTGIFPILEKKRHHRSNKYNDAPMPYMQRLDHYGIALHAGELPGRPASHGCVRLPEKFAARLFAATRVGTPVLIGAFANQA